MLFLLALGGAILLTYLAITIDQPLDVRGLRLSQTQARTLFGVFAALSPIGLFCLGATLYVALAYDRRVALTNKHLILPRPTRMGLSRDEIQIPLDAISDVSIREFIGSTKLLRIEHPEGVVHIPSNMLRSRAEFDQLCRAVQEAVGGATLTTEQSAFRFLDPGPLADGDLELVLATAEYRDTRRGVVPQYEFELRLTGTTITVGLIKLRIRLTDQLKDFGGNLSYDVDESHRGHKYAARGCRLLFPLARRHGLNSLLVTCAPDNAASRRTCELLGARYVDTIEVELEPGQYRPTCRFVVSLEHPTAR